MSQISICNQALMVYCGQGRITSLNEDNPRAEQCAEHYDAALKACLERHWWNFAGARVALAQLENDRASEWDFCYQKPTGALAIRWVNDPAVARHAIAAGESPDIDRETEGQVIYCDVENAVCAFTQLIERPSLYPQYFSDALATELASRIVQPLTESSSRIQRVERAKMEKMDEAIALDRRNDRPVQVSAVPDYLRDRGVS